jgi:hypothetical protein
VEGNAEALPFPSAAFDSYTIAFGIRNVTDRLATLREAHRSVLCFAFTFACCAFAFCLLLHSTITVGARHHNVSSMCFISVYPLPQDPCACLSPPVFHPSPSPLPVPLTRVLRPGGRLLCLEFSKVVVPGMQQLYDLYSFNVIPQIGR